MTYVEGTKIDDLDAIDDLGVDRERIVTRLTEIYIKMIVEDGLFHADPHPGNLAVQADGTIVFYDFGMTGRLGPETRSHLVDFYVGIATDDIDQVIDSFVAMEALDPTADRQMVRELFEIAFEQFRGADLEEFDVEGIVSEFEGAMYEFPMRIPQDLAHVVRVTTVLDGVTRTLAPEFDFIAVVTDYVVDRGMESGGEEIRDRVTDQLRDSARATVAVPPRLDDALTKVDRGDLPLRAAIEDDRGAFVRMARRLVGGFLLSITFPVIAALYALGAGRLALAVGGLSGLVALTLVWSFRRRRGPGFGATPQFTRQEMRRRQGGGDD
jgi:predicted unusual protein kinase regulating ubiquinone biosynthesis (AarF/ABC1/UbiB family)